MSLLSKYSIHLPYLVATAVFSLPFFLMKHGYKRVLVCVCVCECIRALTTAVVQFSSSSRGRMVRHMFSNFLLLWSLSHDLCVTGLTYYASRVGST